MPTVEAHASQARDGAGPWFNPTVAVELVGTLMLAATQGVPSRSSNCYGMPQADAFEGTVQKHGALHAQTGLSPLRQAGDETLTDLRAEHVLPLVWQTCPNGRPAIIHPLLDYRLVGECFP